MLSGLVVFLVLSLPVFAIRNDWTPEEVACAESLGVTLAMNLDSPSVTPSTLAWISDAVVRGVVTEIRSDLAGPYHTLVTVSVAETFKQNTGSTITIRLLSGPAFYEPTGKIVDVTTSTEPTFAVSEDVLLFLTNDYLVFDGTDPLLYAHGPDEFIVVAKGKYIVLGSMDLLNNARHSLEVLSLSETLREIRNTIQAQSNTCE